MPSTPNFDGDRTLHGGAVLRQDEEGLRAGWRGCAFDRRLGGTLIGGGSLCNRCGGVLGGFRCGRSLVGRGVPLSPQAASDNTASTATQVRFIECSVA